MAPKRRTTRRTPYDPTRPDNWLVVKLREELNKKGINPPTNTRHSELVKMFNQATRPEYESNNSTGDVTVDVPSSSPQVAASHNASHDNNNGGLVNLLHSLTNTVASLQANMVQLTSKVNALSSPAIPSSTTTVSGINHAALPTRTVSAAAGSEAQLAESHFTGWDIYRNGPEWS